MESSLGRLFLEVGVLKYLSGCPGRILGFLTRKQRGWLAESPHRLMAAPSRFWHENQVHISAKNTAQRYMSERNAASINLYKPPDFYAQFNNLK